MNLIRAYESNKVIITGKTINPLIFRKRQNWLVVVECCYPFNLYGIQSTHAIFNLTLNVSKSLN